MNAESDADYAAVRQALTAAALELAQKIVRDAEGATKFMTIRVEEAGTEEALKVAYAVAHRRWSRPPFASDPNLGRILAAVATPASTTWTSRTSACGWTMCWSPSTAAAIRPTRKPTASAS